MGYKKYFFMLLMAISLQDYCCEDYLSLESTVEILAKWDPNLLFRLLVRIKRIDLAESTLDLVTDISLPFTLDLASHSNNESIINKCLSKIKDLEKAALIVDRLDSKKRLDKRYNNIRETLMLGLFKNENWVNKILTNNKSPENFLGGVSISEQLAKKYKTKNPNFLKEILLSRFIKETSPLIGYFNEIDAIATSVSKIEKNDQNEGYVTFIHGRIWAWNYVNDVWNMICALNDDRNEISNNISLRQRDINIDVIQLHKIREELVASGNTGKYLASSSKNFGKEDVKRTETTFLTNTLFANLDIRGESPLFYCLHNAYAIGSSSPVEIFKKLLQTYNLEEYKNEFDDLFECHANTNRSGEILTISIAEEKVDEIVYPALAGGYRKSNKKTSDILKEVNKKIISPSENYFQDYKDKDGLVFCAVALQIPGEENVCKIRSVHLADPEKYVDYRQKLQNLFEKIKKNNKNYYSDNYFDALNSI